MFSPKLKHMLDETDDIEKLKKHLEFIHFSTCLAIQQVKEYAKSHPEDIEFTSILIDEYLTLFDEQYKYGNEKIERLKSNMCLNVLNLQ